MTPGAAAQALVPGDPGRVRSLAAQLASLAAGLTAAADSVQGAAAHDWRGEAALAFAAAVGATPGPLRAGGEAFGAAAAVVAFHAAVLEEAQAMARQAAALHEQARTASALWAAHTDERERVARRAAGGDAGAAAQLTHLPVVGADPGDAARLRSERLLVEARAMVAESGRRVAQVLARGAALAPREPGLVDRVVRRGEQWNAQTGLGVVESLVDFGLLGQRLSPSAAVLRPRGWGEDLLGLGKGMANSLVHPVATGKAMLDWDTWGSNPARALGHLGGNVVIGAATDGAGVAAPGLKAGGLVSKLKPSALFSKPANPPLAMPITSFAKDDPLGTYVKKVPPLEGHYDVAAHGNQYQVQIHRPDGNWHMFDDEQLARYISAQPDYHGGPIRLLSCFTGEVSDGVAQRLASRMGVEVVAPSSKLWMWPDGQVAIGLDWQKNDGEWLTFKPQGVTR